MSRMFDLRRQARKNTSSSCISGRLMSCLPGKCEVITSHTVGLLTIPKAGIKPGITMVITCIHSEHALFLHNSKMLICIGRDWLGYACMHAPKQWAHYPLCGEHSTVAVRKDHVSGMGAAIIF